MDERSQADHLSRYLDDRVLGAVPPSTDNRELAELAGRYLALGQAAAPSGARERVLGRVTAPPNSGPPNGSASLVEHSPRLVVIPTIGSNGHHALPPPLSPARRSSEPPTNALHPPHLPVWLFAVLSLVAVVIGAAVHQGPSLVSRFASQEPFTIDAPTLTGLAGAETLLDVTVPALLVPSGDSVRTCLSHITIPPHTRSTWSARDAPCCPGARLNYVLAGTYVVWPEAPAEVLYAGQAPATFPAGSEITLQAGDAILLGSDTPYSADNPGETPVELLQQILASPPAFPRGTATLEGWNEHDYDMRDIPLQGGPMSMRLLRMTLEPQESLTPPPGVEFMQVNLPTGPNDKGLYDVLASFQDPGTFVNTSKEEVTLYVLALQPAGVSLVP